MSTSVSLRHLLTQQQRNNKRQRANPQQLAYLQKMFQANPRPNYAAREVIGRRIDMTPRSVQIWFQNNRAKLKKASSRYRRPSLRTVVRQKINGISSVQLCDENDILASCYATPKSPSEDRISIINCKVLEIGSWVRIREPSASGTDLIVFFDDATRSINYTIYHSGVFYTLMLPCAAINSVNLKHVNIEKNEGVLEIDVSSPELIEFTCRAESTAECVPCSDITAGQIWVNLLHNLFGDYDDLLEQASSLITIPLN